MLVMIDGKSRVAKLTTEHAASSYNRPVLVLEDGQALGTFDVALNGVELVRADEGEVAGLTRARFVMPWARVGCRQAVCTCHDAGGWADPAAYAAGCSSCGFRRADQ